MSKILLWIVVIVVALLGLRLVSVAKAKRRARGSETGAPRTPRVETMVRCARCGVFLPRAEATTGPTGPTCGDPQCVQRR
jgi:uncharacterized protein